MTRSVSLNITCYRLIYIFSFSILVSNILNGQETWTVSQFLDYERTQSELPYQDNLDFIKNKAKGMPFIGQYEFRTETDEMEFEQQQYQFRIAFNSRDERKAYDKILAANLERYTLLQQIQELEILEEKYINIIDLYFNQKKMELIREDLDLLADKKIVLKKIIDSENLIDVNDWLSLENDIFSLQSDSLELESQKKEIGYRLLGVDITIPKIDYSDFIQVETLMKVVLDNNNKNVSHPDMALALAEENVASAEFSLEEAEADKWLKFAQLQYSADDKLSFQKEISFSTSIVIPNKNNNRVKKNDAVLELLESRYKTRREEDENKREVLDEEVKLKSLVAQLEEFEKMVSNQKLDIIFESYAEKKLVSPIVLLDLKRSILKNRNKKLKFEKEIYESYISLISKKALLIDSPRINYLSEIGK